MSVETLASTARTRRFDGYPIVKRGMDIFLAALALVLLAPLFAAIALAIRLYDGGPVVFWQRRVGKDGVEFRFPKFRSMVVDAERRRTVLEKANQHGSECVTFKMRHDPRITPVGSLLRKLSLDELPQFWCVLKGDMSLVGPRPALVTEVERYTDSDRRRLGAVPGLTCYWQVEGRGDIPFPKQVEMDVRYIENQSLWVDLTLLFKTIPAVVTGRGAY